MEWAQVRALAADGVSQREIAARLGMNRRTVARLVAAAEPPRYSRRGAGSMLDPLEPVMRQLFEEWPEIRAPRVTEILREDYGYAGSVDLVKRRLAELRPEPVRPAQRTGYRPGQVLQVDWAEMPTRPRIAGRERRVYALICALPFSGASTAHFSFDMTSSRSWKAMSGRSRGWAASHASASMTTCASAVARERDGDRSSLEPAVLAVARALRLSRARLHARDAAREGLRRGRGPLPQDRVLAGAALRVAGRARRASTPTGATGSRCRADTRPAGTSSPSASRMSASAAGVAAGRVRRGRAPSLAGPVGRLSQARPLLLPRAGEPRSSARRAALGPRPVWIEHRGHTSRLRRSYEHGIWQPAPRMRPNRRRSRP